MQVTPVPVANGGCAAPLGVEAGGFGALLALDPADVKPALVSFLADMATMTANALASYNTSPLLLQQNMTSWGSTAVSPYSPTGMVVVNGSSAWLLTVDGTEIEGSSRPGTDVSARLRGVFVEIAELSSSTGLSRAFFFRACCLYYPNPSLAGPVPLGRHGFPPPRPDIRVRSVRSSLLLFL